MRRTDNIATGYRGKYHGPPINDEAKHFYVCPSCGQAVDMRDLGQVFHHEQPGHEPIKDDG